MKKIIGRFQVGVRIIGSYDQEIIIMSEVAIREGEEAILHASNRDSLLFDRAKRNIKQYLSVAEQFGKIVDRTKEARS